MALLESSRSVIASLAPEFTLPGTDGKQYSLRHFEAKRGLLIVFMCNHCPYVIAVHERLSQLAKDFEAKGIAVIGINSNDPAYRIEDSFENMKRTASDWGLEFPYLFDESQEVAKAYDAVCTPDPYLYQIEEGQFKLVYRGRIDDSWKDPSLVKEASLRLAMEALLEKKAPAPDQIPSMGCSIKWKELTESALLKKKLAAQGNS